jgi:hypothetical protein
MPGADAALVGLLSVVAEELMDVNVGAGRVTFTVPAPVATTAPVHLSK